MILAQEVKALRMGQDSGIFQLPNHQVCAGLRDLVYLHGPSLARPLAARVRELNTQRGWITLSDFHTTFNPWKERSCERVQPERAIQVTLTCLNQRCRGTLDDLSLVGMGVLPVELPARTTVASVALDGTELVDIEGIAAGLRPGAAVKLRIRQGEMLDDGGASVRELSCRARIDSSLDAEYFAHGGVLPRVLRLKLG
jgi:hypothetical protein